MYLGTTFYFVQDGSATISHVKIANMLANVEGKVVSV
jgi:hypothetical protein